MLRFATVAALVVVGACEGQGPPLAPGRPGAAVPVHTGDGAPPPPAEVTAERTGLMLRYADGAGGFAAAETVEAVPADRREEVIVIDTTRSPEERGAARWVHVADLRAAGPDGRYPVRVSERAAFERAARTHEAARPAVIVYTTAWCPVCEKARKYLASNGIQYVERDIEKDPGAAAELQRKASAAGVQASGVPVFDVGGTLVQGFDERRLAALLRAG